MSGEREVAALFHAPGWRGRSAGGVAFLRGRSPPFCVATLGGGQLLGSQPFSSRWNSCRSACGQLWLVYLICSPPHSSAAGAGAPATSRQRPRSRLLGFYDAWSGPKSACMMTQPSGASSTFAAAASSLMGWTTMFIMFSSTQDGFRCVVEYPYLQSPHVSKLSAWPSLHSFVRLTDGTGAQFVHRSLQDTLAERGAGEGSRFIEAANVITFDVQEQLLIPRLQARPFTPPLRATPGTCVATASRHTHDTSRDTHPQRHTNTAPPTDGSTTRRG